MNRDHYQARLIWHKELRALQDAGVSQEREIHELRQERSHAR